MVKFQDINKEMKHRELKINHGKSFRPSLRLSAASKSNYVFNGFHSLEKNREASHLEARTKARGDTEIVVSFRRCAAA